MFREALIETAFPFPAVNDAAAREKTLRAGHPSTLHPWAARRPLGLCRAILHAQLTPDTGEQGRAEAVRRTAALARYEAEKDGELMAQARGDIRGKGKKAPRVIDPFCGSGGIPMQAAALGCDAFAGDINPLAALLTEAVAGIPARFRLERGTGAAKHGMLVAIKAATEAFAKDAPEADWIVLDDGRVHGRPDLAGMAGQTVHVVARLWVRTVRSPSPAFSDVHVPLLPSFVLSSSPGREVCVRPVVEGRRWRFEVRPERPADGDDRGLRYAKRGLFRCILSGLPISKEYVRGEIAAGRNGRRLVAVVVDGVNRRLYLSPTQEDENQERIWEDMQVDPMLPIASDNPSLIGPVWGFDRWGRIFDPKPFAHLRSLASHIRIPRKAVLDETHILREILRDAADDHRGYADGGRGPEALADAAALYCALALSRSADRATTLCAWDSSARSECIHGTFQHHKTNMAWCYAEGNPGGAGTGSFQAALQSLLTVVGGLGFADAPGRANVTIRLGTPGRQRLPRRGVVATDPPQLAETSHADTTDFHYPFLRSALRDIFPDFFRTMAAPKLDELALHPALHGGAAGARAFVLEGIGKEFRRLASIQDDNHPATFLYTITGADAGTGGDSLPPDLAAWLSRLLCSGWDVTAIWPLRPDRTARERPLPHSLVVVCRKAKPRTGTLSRAELGAAVRMLSLESRNLLPLCGDDAAKCQMDARFAAFGRAMRALAGVGRVLRPDDTEMPQEDILLEIWRSQPLS